MCVNESIPKQSSRKQKKKMRRERKRRQQKQQLKVRAEDISSERTDHLVTAVRSNGHMAGVSEMEE